MTRSGRARWRDDSELLSGTHLLTLVDSGLANDASEAQKDFDLVSGQALALLNRFREVHVVVSEFAERDRALQVVHGLQEDEPQGVLWVGLEVLGSAVVPDSVSVPSPRDFRGRFLEVVVELRDPLDGSLLFGH